MQAKHLQLAKSLRHELTATEKKLWSRLRNRQMANMKFRRQQPYGPYILDFYCAEAKLVIELDGDTHGAPNQVDDDKERDAFLKSEGLTVLRFWNFEVMQEFEAVLEMIYRTVGQHPLTQTLSPGGARGTGQNISSPLGGED